MARCLVIDGGALVLTADAPGVCSGYLVLDVYEYQTLVQPNGLSREQNFADGVEIGWAIALVMISVWAFQMMRKATK